MPQSPGNQYLADVLERYYTQWRINHEAMEARASGSQFLGQKNRHRIPALVLIAFKSFNV